MLRSLALALLALGLLTPVFADEQPQVEGSVTLIEACSCPMFCQCYFIGLPHDMCKFNIAGKVNEGSYNGTTLDGVLFWSAGDSAKDPATGKAKWERLIFDRRVTPEQREGVQALLRAIYPPSGGVNHASTGEGDITWDTDDAGAFATLDGGKSAEIVLRQSGSAAGEGPIVIDNLVYGSRAVKNTGFYLMPNAVEAWRGEGGDETFEFDGTNGFMITLLIGASGTTSP